MAPRAAYPCPRFPFDPMVAQPSSPLQLGFYRHFKGGLYEVLHVATEEATATPCVVYRSATTGQVWTRGLSAFVESVAWPDGTQGPRFRQVAPAGGADDLVPDYQADVTAFHVAMAPDQLAATPRVLGGELKKLRKRLIEEEVGETIKALDADDLPGVADGIADSLYVLIGTAVAAGIDLHPVWREVQRANMDKRHGPVRADGKRLKPEGWRPPDITGVLMAQGWDPSTAPVRAADAEEIAP